MSTEAPVPSSREFTLVGVAYGLYVAGLFMIWPAWAGLVLAYIKRGDVRGTMLESHYRWLISTFWWWTLAWSVILAGMLWFIIPAAIELGHTARSGSGFMLPWQLIGTGIVGAIALGVVWFWVAYRLLRGTLRLSDGRAIP